MAKFASDTFVPKNPHKYVGKHPIIYRSSWELSLMMVFDQHPSVVQWGSESVQIPYKHPHTGKWSVYVPDFLVIYVDKNGKQHAEMIEVKPAKEVPGYNETRISRKTREIQEVNAAKWQAAMIYCQKRGLYFRVATEKQLFAFKRKK